jgi:hypothetical protein
MKTKKLIFTFFVAVSFLAGSVLYSEGGESSSVTVFGPSEKSTSQSVPDKTESSSSDIYKDYQQGEGPKVKISGPALNASFRVVYDIQGSRMGGIQVSEAVTLPSEGMILQVDPGMGRAFTIVSVDKEGKETLVLNISPEHAIGKRLPKGTYRVYPQDPDGAFAADKLTARVQIGLVGNEVMDPRARGPLYKTEKGQ